LVAETVLPLKPPLEVSHSRLRPRRFQPGPHPQRTPRSRRVPPGHRHPRPRSQTAL